jgi:aminoglycoside phosphotransferase (APT) family kinase protein
VVDVGWDYRVVTVDDRVVFRLPRTDAYADRIAVDVELLRCLSGLPVSIPEPAYVSALPAVIGYAKLPGEPVEDQDLIQAPRECERLGAFLDRLHRFPLDEARRSGLRLETADTWRRGWRETLTRYRRALALLPRRIRREAELRWKEFLTTDENFDFEPSLIHTDLLPQHVLWMEQRITGIIDWSDAQIGDVAMDFAWPSSLPEPAFATILSAYSARDATALKDRARFYEWARWWSEAVHGLDACEPSCVERGVVGIMRQLA